MKNIVLFFFEDEYPYIYICTYSSFEIYFKKKKERKHKLSVTDSEKTKQDNRIESHREMCAAVTLDRMTWEGFLEGMSF